GTVRFDVKCSLSRDGTQRDSLSPIGAEGQREGASRLVVAAHIFPPKGDPQQATFSVQNNEAHESVIVSPLLLWDPNEPHLYKTVLELQRGKEVLDRVQTYFGMRKIDYAHSEEAAGNIALRLNNVARYLRGALHQSYYPDG